MSGTALIAALLLGTASPVPPAVTVPPGAFCSTRPPVDFSVARTRRIVRNAEVVVRAVMVGSATGKTLKPWDADTLAFEVREVLKGENVPDTLPIPGVIVDWDDVQEDTVPYRSHRIMYSGGECITSFYKLGTEYLLLLNRMPEVPRLAGLTPYWAILAPTNEQIRGPDDPWVAWVRATLQAKPTPRR